MSNFTPGPWIVEDTRFDSEDDGIVLYAIRMSKPIISIKNNKLIEAAPDLLQSLLEIEDIVESYMDVASDSRLGFAMQKAAKAIAKASGEKS